MYREVYRQVVILYRIGCIPRYRLNILILTSAISNAMYNWMMISMLSRAFSQLPYSERKDMTMSESPILYMVIPCYNEEDVLPITCDMFKSQMDRMIAAGQVSNKSKIMFVNDGSKDKTWEIISDLSKKDDTFCGLSLSRNRGHQNALLAGLMEARSRCDIAISIDCDGQDDITVMSEMVEKYSDGVDIVYGVRSSRETDTFFKRFTAQSFYKVLGKMGVETVYNHADYRLMSKRALNAFSEFKEVNLFLRGMVPLVGFKTASVYYERNERLAGESHYPLKKMIALAVNGITSLSIKPIRIITMFGFAVSLISFVMIIWSLCSFFTGNTVSGWASTMIVILFMGGVQMLSLGVIGEYVGRTYLETKHRPRFIIGDKTANL